MLTNSNIDATPETDITEPVRFRLKVLVCAYACNPSQGSEEGVGWGWVRAMAERYEVTVITADFHQQDILHSWRALPGEVQKSLNFIYVKNRPWHYRPSRIWKRIESSFAKPLMNLAYQNWLRFAFKTARDESTDKDLFHLLTYVGWRFPGKFYQLDLPFVWGPIGGLANTPFRLLRILGISGGLYHGARNLINSTQIRFLAGPKLALRKADGNVIAATSEIKRALLRHFKTQSTVICEVGSLDDIRASLRARGPKVTLEVCWSGTHLTGKALPLLLRALANIPTDVRYRLRILGDGPLHKQWRALARKLGIESNCKWYGQLPRSDALRIMQESHVFAITSLKDLTSTVCLEALSVGLPVVCLDHCGFADVVDTTCGIKIPVSSIADMISGFRSAITALYRDEPLRCRLAKGALLRSEAFSWTTKMDKLDTIYHQIPGLRSNASPANHQCAAERSGEFVHVEKRS